MKYTLQQQKYIDSVDGNAHMTAVTIIGLLENALKAQKRLLICYRIGGHPPEWVFTALDKAEKAGIET